METYSDGRSISSEMRRDDIPAGNILVSLYRDGRIKLFSEKLPVNITRYFFNGRISYRSWEIFKSFWKRWKEFNVLLIFVLFSFLFTSIHVNDVKSAPLLHFVTQSIIFSSNPFYTENAIFFRRIPSKYWKKIHFLISFQIFYKICE